MKKIVKKHEVIGNTFYFRFELINVYAFMKKFYTLIVLSILLGITSCKKEPGEIQGVVMQKIFDNEFRYLQRIQPAPEADVFLAEAGSFAVIDRVRTSFNGLFSFTGVEDGTYVVFVYSDDTARIASPVSIISEEISVKAGKTIWIDTLYSFKGIGVEKGNATISGKIWLINYKKNGYEIKDISLAQEVDVYLIYGNHKSYDIRTRTNYDGTFTFTNLLKGDYVVYVYSEAEDAFGNLTGATEKVAHKKFITINRDNQEVFVTDTIKLF
ncbi:MAG: hypothetical protein N2662_12025 [Bacteroidales bacterium]|nr:hypothetical protein [Bacteroidales bacterium]